MELGQLYTSELRGHKHLHPPQYPRSCNLAVQACQQESLSGELLFSEVSGSVGGPSTLQQDPR